MTDVLLVDSTQYSPTTPLFADCLGAGDAFFDEAPYLSPLDRSVAHKVAFRLLRRPATSWALNEHFLEAVRELRPGVILVVKGAWLRPGTLAEAKGTGATLVNFSTDDPWNPKASCPDLLASIPEFDLYCSVRRAAIPDILRAGCPRAEHVMCGFKPDLHYPPLRPVAPHWEAALVGGADEDRIPYAWSLVRAFGREKVCIALFGGYWQRDPAFRPFARGVAVGRAYRKALWETKVVVCLVRRANRDDHSMKTWEVPACGRFALLEDTPTHREAFEEGRTAAFFGSPEEMADKAAWYARHDAARERIAEAGCRLALRGGHAWRDRLAQILEAAGGLRPVSRQAGIARHTGE